MPWEVGYFDGFNRTVGVLPIEPDAGSVDFSQEEFLGLYPKVEVPETGLWVNRTHTRPVSKEKTADYLSIEKWMSGSEKLRL